MRKLVDALRTVEGPDYAEGFACGDAEARRDIRRAIAGPLRTLREQHTGGTRFGSDCPECTALIAIDRATRAPRKARAK